MFTAQQIELLQSAPLPGLSAQLLGAPVMRRNELQKGIAAVTTARQAAVLLLLHPSQEQYCFTLIRRNTYEGVHSGQVAFPGGQWDPTDIDYTQTAQRETHEELGVASQAYRIIKKLSPLYIPPSNFMMHPFVGIAHEKLDFIPDPREVVDVFHIPLQELLREDWLVDIPMQTSYQRFGTVPAFVWGEVEVWGATAMVLSEFRELILALKLI